MSKTYILKTAIIGATGYTGLDLVYILSKHPKVKILNLCATKNLGKNFFINSSLVILIFLLDRISKIYVINLDKKFPGSEIFASKYLNINLIWNEGIAFGLLSFNESYFYNILTFLILIYLPLKQ